MESLTRVSADTIFPNQSSIGDSQGRYRQYTVHMQLLHLALPSWLLASMCMCNRSPPEIPHFSQLDETAFWQTTHAQLGPFQFRCNLLVISHRTPRSHFQYPFRLGSGILLLFALAAFYLWRFPRVLMCPLVLWLQWDDPIRGNRKCLPMKSNYAPRPTWHRWQPPAMAPWGNQSLTFLLLTSRKFYFQHSFTTLLN